MQVSVYMSQSAVFMISVKGVPSAVVRTVRKWCQDYAAGQEGSSTSEVPRLQKFCRHNWWVFAAPRKLKRQLTTESTECCRTWDGGCWQGLLLEGEWDRLPHKWARRRKIPHKWARRRKIPPPWDSDLRWHLLSYYVKLRPNRWTEKKPVLLPQQTRFLGWDSAPNPAGGAYTALSFHW